MSLKKEKERTNFYCKFFNGVNMGMDTNRKRVKKGTATFRNRVNMGMYTNIERVKKGMAVHLETG